MLRLTVTINEQEFFDEETRRFSKSAGEDVTLELEHSLVSLSKWEAIHGIPFLSSADSLTTELVFDYLKCMVVTENVDPNLLAYCTQEDLERIQKYISSGASATTFPNLPKQRSGPKETITSELIYYWMTGFQIPFEAENWHLSRLLNLIQICSIKSSKPQKRSRAEAMAERNRINAERKAKLNTTG